MAKSYTYAVARIRALEARMLTPALLARMMEAPDLDRAFFVLNEASYADHISGTLRPFDFDEIIDRERRVIHGFLMNYAGGDETLKIFLRKYDYGNAKTLLRVARLKERLEAGLVSDFGNVKGEDLVSYIIDGEGLVPDWLERAINAAAAAFEEGKNPAEIDRVLDLAYLMGLKGSGCRFLQDLAILWSGTTHPFNLGGSNLTIELFKRIKRKAFGIEPLIVFWLVKTFEARLIRQILVAKKHHLNLDVVRERGRVIYA